MNQNPAYLTKVNIHEVQEKLGDKKSVYRFLTQDCNVYMPKIGSTNIYFFKQIVRNQKQVRLFFFNFASSSKEKMSKCQLSLAMKA